MNSLTEVAAELQSLNTKMDLVLGALQTAANEAAVFHQERIDLTRRVTQLERRISALEERMAQ